MKHWINVTPEEAKLHPLYGIKGWLVVFAGGSLLQLLGVFGEVVAVRNVASADSAGGFLWDNQSPILWLNWLLTIDALITAAVLGLLFARSKSFRPVTTILMLAFWPLSVIIGFVSGNGMNAASEAGRSLIPWLISCAAWVTYFNRSRRVRVTFEYQVHAEPERGTIIASRQIPSRSPEEGVQVAVHTGSGLPPARSELAGRSGVPSEAQWSSALSEVDGIARRPGLWAKCFAQAAGNEQVAKASYMTTRAFELVDEENELARQALIREQEFRDSIERADNYRGRLDPSQARIAQELEAIKASGRDAFQSMVQLVHLLGGSVTTSTVGLIGARTEWLAVYDGRRHTFHNQHAFVDWVLEVVVPQAKSALPSTGAI